AAVALWVREAVNSCVAQTFPAATLGTVTAAPLAFRSAAIGAGHRRHGRGRVRSTCAPSLLLEFVTASLSENAGQARRQWAPSTAKIGLSAWARLLRQPRRKCRPMATSAGAHVCSQVALCSRRRGCFGAALPQTGAAANLRTLKG